MDFDVHQIMNLVGQLGGDHQQAAQQLQGLDQVDPQEHAGLLSQLGVDPHQLQTGGYQGHLDAQKQPDFRGYQPGSDYASQQPDFGSRSGQGESGYEQGGDYEQDSSSDERGDYEQGSGRQEY